ncbi:MAG TPA: 3-deoxy-8-phosphooctulonate synthase [Syntrophorhabdaceae bacterium]|nr:3-deoxy-8-phosphooctulonate synthase [Syntrophorhabdaceae bacterium]HOL05567.1 3-deoxy-8-phosphooctulonate synthase [Syntrophorhabdaceae bacterium]HPP41855.1 3-deoxy-8-phosphooctulonate synthase [Syntrophorhabdaceae bacterium]
MQKEIDIRGIKVGGRPFVFIGGPCVIETEAITMKIAELLTDITTKIGIPFIFKSSYDKANRTSITSYRGPGIEEGLKVLSKIRDALGCPILTDVHSKEEAGIAGDVVDVVQVPALLSRQTDILIACGRTGKAVNIKKGQFMSPYDMRHAIEKVENTGNKNIIVTERGTCFGYNTLVNDFRAIPILKGLGYPVVFDATHSVQRPGALQGCSGGEREFVLPLAKAAVALGVDGVFMEVHIDPSKALCDGENSVAIGELPDYLRILKRIGEAL